MQQKTVACPPPRMELFAIVSVPMAQVLGDVGAKIPFRWEGAGLMVSAWQAEPVVYGVDAPPQSVPP